MIKKHAPDDRLTFSLKNVRENSEVIGVRGNATNTQLGVNVYIDTVEDPANANAITPSDLVGAYSYTTTWVDTGNLIHKGNAETISEFVDIVRHDLDLPPLQSRGRK